MTLKARGFLPCERLRRWRQGPPITASDGASTQRAMQVLYSPAPCYRKPEYMPYLSLDPPSTPRQVDLDTQADPLRG